MRPENVWSFDPKTLKVGRPVVPIDQSDPSFISQRKGEKETLGKLADEYRELRRKLGMGDYHDIPGVPDPWAWHEQDHARKEKDMERFNHVRAEMVKLMRKMRGHHGRYSNKSRLWPEDVLGKS